MESIELQSSDFIVCDCPKKKFIASVDNSILSYHKSVSKSHGEVLF